MTDQDQAKRAAAAKALEFVRPGMRLGLGTGSTAAIFVDLLGKRVANGLEVLCVPTSERTHAQALALDIPLTTLDETPELDLTIDGADEFDPQLSLIKGGGGALLREKIVAGASKSMIVITDASKEVAVLGRFPLPVEIVPFGLGATRVAVGRVLKGAGCSGPVALRQAASGQNFVTDGGHFILDCALGRIPDPAKLALALNAVPGVVETGLFIGMASAIVVAGENGVRVLEKAV
ncbi:MAG: ribose-5-phosphate isomerase RpiA [Beijerinckiaceae bacterium]